MLSMLFIRILSFLVVQTFTMANSAAKITTTQTLPAFFGGDNNRTTKFQNKLDFGEISHDFYTYFFYVSSV